MEYVPPINGDLGNPNRSYINANPGSGIEGSIPPAPAIENPMREILAVISGAGLTPNGGNLAQLLAAINALIVANPIADATTTVKGKVELADNTEALGGTDTTRAVTSAGLASSKSLAANGYYKLPGGLILQWGVTTSFGPGAGLAVTLPTAFPTAFRAVNCTTLFTGSTSSAVTDGTHAEINSLSQFTAKRAGNGTYTAYWFAIGH